MSDTPKEQLHAWCVTLIHGPAAPVVNVIIAPSSVAATALVMRQAYVEIGVPKEDLTGVGVNEITLDWLRRAVRALETGETSGQVLSLVPQAAPEPTKAEQAAQMNMEAHLASLNPAQRAQIENIGADTWPPFPPVA